MRGRWRRATRSGTKPRRWTLTIRATRLAVRRSTTGSAKSTALDFGCGGGERGSAVSERDSVNVSRRAGTHSCRRIRFRRPEDNLERARSCARSLRELRVQTQSREKGGERKGRGLGEQRADARCWTCHCHRCESRKHPCTLRAALATAATATGATSSRPDPPSSLPAANSAWTGAIARQLAPQHPSRAPGLYSETHRGCGRAVVLRAAH